jgi:hypothetical protein
MILPGPVWVLSEDYVFILTGLFNGDLFGGKHRVRSEVRMYNKKRG